MRRLPLLLDVAVRPREAMRWILDNRGTRGILVLVTAAFGSSALKDLNLPNVLNQARSVSTATAVAVIAGGIVVGLLISIGIFYGLSWIATVAGRFFGGTGDYRSVRTALAWGFAPVIIALLYRVPALIFWPAAMGKSPPIKVNDSIRITAGALADLPGYQLAILMLLDTAILIWWLIVASATLGEAQRVSSWAGFGNLVLAFVLPIVTAAAIAIAAYLAFK